MGKLYYYPAVLHFMIILLVMGSAICTCFATNTTSLGCFSREKNALLKLKASFKDPANSLSSWHTGTDCCMWRGVVCDSETGHVVGLRLRNTHWRSDFPDDDYKLISNHLDSSLLELKYLSYLDLSANDFQFSPIPAFLGSMKQLQHLNLSIANFSGGVPHNLGNLSNLRVLDLSWQGRDLLVDDLMWASNLSFLEYLDMSYVDLSQAKHLSEVLFHLLPSILVLRLSETQLDNTQFSQYSCTNSSLLTNIQQLDLSYNSFYGEFPCFLHNMTSLRVLDLSANSYISSNREALLRLRNLVHVSLQGNLLNHNVDWIFEFLLNKCHLKSLILANNEFYGELSGRLIRNLSTEYCWTHKLETLDLSSNGFSGHLPREMSELKQLTHLALHNNEFTGPIPTSIGKLRALRYLFLHANHLCGEFPISLGQLSALEKIDISSNSFNGTLSELHFAKLSKLEDLLAESINLSVAFDWVPPFQLKKLYMSSSKIGGGQFPQWLRTQKALEKLDLGNCSILGSLPECLKYLNLTDIFLPHNMIIGSIPKLPPYLKYLDLSHNMISSSIPKLPLYLEYLRLSHNMINGSVPKLPPYLTELDLSDNKIDGSIPKLPPNLGYSDLSLNLITGSIPKLPPNLKHLNISHNLITNSIPKLPLNLEGLYLSHNMINGSIPELPTAMEYLDLSHNHIEGSIPKFGSNLLSLGLSYNMMDGSIPDSLCKPKNLYVIDLSRNRFYGHIPYCLAALQNLMVLRLSSNELSGVIPNSIGEARWLMKLGLSNNSHG